MPATFQKQLLAWFDRCGRHHLPWQKPRTAYRVWLSETMLQQTQVATVIPYFEKFIARFPTIEALAAAPIDELLALWAGLGYYSRAKNLHRTAQLICSEHQGVFPTDLKQLMALPGIGRSTAGAIIAQAFNRYGVILDGNVRRVLIRYHALPGDPTTLQKQLWALAETYTPTKRVADYTQAIMDLGALVCTRGQAKCTLCPLQSGCLAYRHGQVGELPSKHPSKTKPVKSALMLVMRDPSGHILLLKRPLSGLWNGLWCLPSVDDDRQIVSWLSQQRLRLKRQQAFMGFRHTFSHFHLDIDVALLDIDYQKTWQVAENHDERWFSLEHALQLGIPAPIKKILSQLT